MIAPNGLTEIITQFGDPTRMSPAAWEDSQIVRIVLPESLGFENLRVTRITAHHLIAAHLSDTLKKIHDAGLWAAIDPYGGGYAARAQRGSQKLSLHAWGLAWDFRPEENALGTAGTMDQRVVGIFEAAGFTWGGRFHKRLDPMHFQMGTNY